ncbi:MAG: hypothetical protein CSA45_06995 [Gammaproteobacteria bacterium]|nr:MAG: hypothetical protein CSA45_06995 [Gammaproteobacteria bacterium]
MTYHQFITDLSSKHARASRDLGLTPAEQAKVKHDAELSRKKAQLLLEQSRDVGFCDYLAAYFSQLQAL